MTPEELKQVMKKHAEGALVELQRQLSNARTDARKAKLQSKINFYTIALVQVEDKNEAHPE